ncbi:hypothetical protein EVAR_79470_1 [Eumeta japonica]|uniref:Uncharacterized protein n=1 Tax=Eumeta variegata TaxID=151549 RepID=A0A4C1UF12_EUMVA|nr:hypothetical protein EVAR_79470_1 [Eumeta japonica]
MLRVPPFGITRTMPMDLSGAEFDTTSCRKYFVSQISQEYTSKTTIHPRYSRRGIAQKNSISIKKTLKTILIGEESWPRHQSSDSAVWDVYCGRA